MSNRNKIIALIVFIGILALIGYKLTRPVYEPIAIDKPIESQTLKLTTYEKTLQYVGRVDTSSLKKLSFKSSAKIQSIEIAVGDEVQKGDLLITLNKEDLLLAKNAAESQMNAALAQYNKALKGTPSEDLNNAKSNVDKAKASLEYALKQLETGKTLFETGVISQNGLDQLNLNYTIQLSSLSQAEEVYDKLVRGVASDDIKTAEANYLMAKTDYDAKVSLYEDATMIAPISGTVVSIPYESYEMVPAGYPVVVIRNSDQVVKMGVTAEDFKKIEIGQKFRCNDLNIEGKITRLSEVPDATTHLYEIEGTLNKSDLLIGEIITCSIVIGEESGIIIPIESILNDGEDYVFLFKNNTAYRTVITKSQIMGNSILVQGLVQDDELIVKNINQLKDGQTVIQKYK